MPSPVCQLLNAGKIASAELLKMLGRHMPGDFGIGRCFLNGGEDVPNTAFEQIQFSGAGYLGVTSQNLFDERCS